jgi:SNF2 family DNA or RNA helicase
VARLEELQAGTRVLGLVPGPAVTVKSASWIGQQAVELVFEDAGGALHKRLVYREDEHTIEVAQAGRPWSFDADGHLFRLVSEAHRIKLAWLFDPYVAVTASSVEPLPHQISAVYEEMLPRQPLRFLLADDPGAGKTIMAGLLIKELLIRGDLERCLIVSPGSLTDQWQDELDEKFGLDFDILSRDMITHTRSGNPFLEHDLLIARMDQLSRNPELQEKLKAAPEWDLVVCDESHRMSGHVVGDEISYTKRYRLGQALGGHCRNFLLMTATPHNGNEEDFQIFLALLDGDRFEGRYRDGVHSIDPSDLMRRLVKEDLKRFDGTPLFPERKAYTVQYDLSPLEAQLYAEVTDYVRDEMNRAERALPNARRVNVGFALMTLQRRLASSPEAIFRSIERRRGRLESRLREERMLLRGRAEREVQVGIDPFQAEDKSWDDWDDIYDEAPQAEREALEENVVDRATAARTVAELSAEIDRLKQLEALARQVVQSAQDTKWSELSRILDDPLMIDENGHRRKIVIFTEFRDTLSYLNRRIKTRLGTPEAVVEIHGGVLRDERRKIVHSFMHDKEVLILLANDAAGEGVNLQRAHLMVNYDLPWNPNRLEQRFGRIHRIGQREVCHLWNLLAKDTREGDVYIRLLDKLERERDALGGKVYDVLGLLFDQKPLRELLMEAVVYGNDPEVRARLTRSVDGAVDREHLATLLAKRALVADDMDTRKIQAIREDMERAHARRLQPHFIQGFFTDAFTRLGGKIARREPGRFEVTHVPADIRERDRQVGVGAPVLKRYERVCFDKEQVGDSPRAYLVSPGSPLLDASLDLVLERHADLLKRGAVLIDENDPSDTPRLLFYVQHAVQDSRRTKTGGFQVISERLHFVEVPRDGDFRIVGMAPYLDYRSVTADELVALAPECDAAWLRRDWEHEVLAHAITKIVPGHVAEVRAERIPYIDKVEQAVKMRLQKEINYWDHRAEDLKVRERAGKQTRLPAQVAAERAEKLAERMRQRVGALQLERGISPQPPVIKGGALVIPVGLLRRLRGDAPEPGTLVDAAARKRVELLAMAVVMAAERALGREPRDVSSQTGLGHDIESRDPAAGHIYFIEVKGRVAGADSVTLTKNEILRALNVPERFRLAIVQIENDVAGAPVYVTDYDFGQPGFAQTSSTFSLASLLERGGAPR